MKIADPCVVIRPSQLSPETFTQLKDGQQVLAKIIRVSADNALLEIAGNTIPARNEGTQLPSGSVVLFNVKTNGEGRIELKIVANLTENGNRATPAATPGNRNQLMVAALKEQGLPPTAANLQTLNRLLSDIRVKFNFSPEPKAAAFLMAKNIPLNMGTLVMAWVQTDQKLRNYWWNQLDQAGRLDPKAILAFTKDVDQILKWLTGGGEPILTKGPQIAGEPLPQQFLGNSQPPREAQPTKSTLPEQVFQGEGQPPENSLTAKQPSPEQALRGDALFLKEPQGLKQHALEATLPNGALLSKETTVAERTEETGPARQDELQKITELLTHRSDRETVRGRNSGNEDYNAYLPLLVRDSQEQVHELVIRRECEDNTREAVKPGQTFRLIIPTDNLGEIEVTVSWFAHSTRIHFNVESNAVKDYLLGEIGGLQAATGPQTQIGIETVQPKPVSGGMDIWM